MPGYTVRIKLGRQDEARESVYSYSHTQNTHTQNTEIDFPFTLILALHSLAFDTSNRMGTLATFPVSYKKYKTPIQKARSENEVIGGCSISSFSLQLEEEDDEDVARREENNSGRVPG